MGVFFFCAPAGRRDCARAPPQANMFPLGFRLIAKKIARFRARFGALFSHAFFARFFRAYFRALFSRDF